MITVQNLEAISFILIFNVRFSILNYYLLLCSQFFITHVGNELST